MNQITIYTDGSAHNANHNRGGYGIVMINGSIRHFCGGQYINTTSARMELLASVRALQKCEPGDHVTLYSDNQYTVNCIARKWIFKWERQQFRQRKNADLLRKLLKEYKRLNGNVKFKWVRGHNGNEYNELADELADMGAHKKLIIKDRMP